MNEERAPRVFISYSHDSEEHCERVRALAERLRGDGVDCRLDQWNESPPQGWPAWMDEQVEEADFVLVVATAAYKAKSKISRRPAPGKGVAFESILILQDLYDARMWNESFIPVLLEGGDDRDIVRPLRPYTYYRPEIEEGYEDLYRRLTGQPELERPPLGKRRVLKPRGPARAAAKGSSAAGTSAPGSSVAPPSAAGAGSGTANVGGATPTAGGGGSAAGAGASPNPPWYRRFGPWVYTLALLFVVGGVWTSFEPGGEEAPTKNVQVPPSAKDLLSVTISENTEGLGVSLDAEPSVGVVDVALEFPDYNITTSTDARGFAKLGHLGEPGDRVLMRIRAEGYEPIEHYVTIGGEREILELEPEAETDATPGLRVDDSMPDFQGDLNLETVPINVGTPWFEAGASPGPMESQTPAPDLQDDPE